MAIDPLTESTFPLSQVPKRIPHLRNNRPVHVSTVWRWALSGLRGVRLETVLVGGTRVTSASALRRFFQTLSDVGHCSHQRAEENRDGKLQQIERDLDAAGITVSSNRVASRKM